MIWTHLLRLVCYDNISVRLAQTAYRTRALTSVESNHVDSVPFSDQRQVVSGHEHGMVQTKVEPASLSEYDTAVHAHKPNSRISRVLVIKDMFRSQ